MKTLATIAATLAAALAAVPATASAEPIIEPAQGQAPGLFAVDRLDFKVNEGQYAFDRKCADVQRDGIRYTGVRTHDMSCALARVYIVGKRPIPSAYRCLFFPLRLAFVSQVGTVPFYHSRTTRFDCLLNGVGRALAFTARSPQSDR